MPVGQSRCARPRRQTGEDGCDLLRTNNLASTLACAPGTPGQHLSVAQQDAHELGGEANAAEDVDGPDAWSCADLCIACGRTRRGVADTDRANDRTRRTRRQS